MDSHQSVKMINWLDEERRKDKVLIAQLEATNAAQQELLEDHVRRIQTLEGELAQLQEKAVNEVSLKQMFDGLRAEVNGTLGNAAEKRRNAEREAKKQRESDRESLARTVELMRQELTARFDRDLGPRVAFEERINALAAEVEESAKVLHHEADSGQRSLEFLEEQRRIDSRRLTELQEEMVEGQKRIDSLMAKIDLVEALARRNERYGADIQDLRQRQDDWTENQATVGQQRERLLTEMQARLDSFAKQMDGYAQLVTGWGETHGRLNKYLEDADRIAERVDRRVNEVSEMARLSEERFRHEWDTFVKDDHKRWRQFTLTASEAWREHDRHAEEETKRVEAMREMVQRHEELLGKFFKLEREYASMVGDHLQAMMDEVYNNHSKSE